MGAQLESLCAALSAAPARQHRFHRHRIPDAHARPRAPALDRPDLDDPADELVTHHHGQGVLTSQGAFVEHVHVGTAQTDEWRQALEINFLSAVRLTRLALPTMIERGSGSIVTVASECGRQPDVFFIDYSVTKAALINPTKSWANEFGSTESGATSSPPARPDPHRASLRSRQAAMTV
nr:SDR family NAD(P)-dependent oxidoreductase [Mycobacterium sp. AT1]